MVAPCLAPGAFVLAVYVIVPSSILLAFTV
jgi:hypothetical protein